MAAVIPQDTFMLLSFVNTKLRDEYSTLDDLCLSLGVERHMVESQLSAAGFNYDATVNKFW